MRNLLIFIPAVSCGIAAAVFAALAWLGPVPAGPADASSRMHGLAVFGAAAAALLCVVLLLIGVLCFVGAPLDTSKWIE